MPQTLPRLGLRLLQLSLADVRALAMVRTQIAAAELLDAGRLEGSALDSVR